MTTKERARKLRDGYAKKCNPNGLCAPVPCSAPSYPAYSNIRAIDNGFMFESGPVSIFLKSADDVSEFVKEFLKESNND